MSILYLFFSCNESVLYKQTLYEPNIIVVEDKIYFEDKSVFENPHSDFITIINSGNDDNLNVSIYLNSPIIFSNDNFVLEPNEHKEVLVNFFPETETTYNTNIDIMSNDPDTPHIILPIEANGIAPVIDVYSDNYLFDDIKLGCNEEEILYIGNTGSLDLEIYDILQYSIVFQKIYLLI